MKIGRIVAGIFLTVFSLSNGSGLIAMQEERLNTKHEKMVITRGTSQEITKGQAEYFTGVVEIQPLFNVNEPSRSSGARVTFHPGARSAWHTHPLGQVLIVTAGSGWIQQWGEPRQEMREGDVIWTPPGVKHWHGAAATTSMTHIAIQEALMEK